MLSTSSNYCLKKNLNNNILCGWHFEVEVLHFLGEWNTGQEILVAENSRFEGWSADQIINLLVLVELVNTIDLLNNVLQTVELVQFLDFLQDWDVPCLGGVLWVEFIDFTVSISHLVQEKTFQESVLHVHVLSLENVVLVESVNWVFTNELVNWATGNDVVNNAFSNDWDDFAINNLVIVVFVFTNDWVNIFANGLFINLVVENFDIGDNFGGWSVDVMVLEDLVHYRSVWVMVTVEGGCWVLLSIDGVVFVVDGVDWVNVSVLRQNGVLVVNSIVQNTVNIVTIV